MGKAGTGKDSEGAEPGPLNAALKSVGPGWQPLLLGLKAGFLWYILSHLLCFVGWEGLGNDVVEN